MKYLDNIEESIVNAVGYTGFILLSGHAIPNIYKMLTYSKDVSNIDERIVLLSSVSLNIVSGALMLSYGILIKSEPIQFGVLSFIVVNLICFVGTLVVIINKNQSNRLF